MALVRHPWIYWSIVGALAGASALGLLTAMRGVNRQRDAWGSTTQVLVARGAIEPGATLDASMVSSRRVPAAVVPPSALHGLPATPVVVRRGVDAGETLVAGDVAAGLIPDGWLAIAVDTPSSLHARVGSGASVLADRTVVARDCLVVDVATDGSSLVLAVPAGAAPAVADAASRHAAVVALSATPPR